MVEKRVRLDKPHLDDALLTHRGSKIVQKRNPGNIPNCIDELR